MGFSRAGLAFALAAAWPCDSGLPGVPHIPPGPGYWLRMANLSHWEAFKLLPAILKKGLTENKPSRIQCREILGAILWVWGVSLPESWEEAMEKEKQLHCLRPGASGAWSCITPSCSLTWNNNLSPCCSQFGWNSSVLATERYKRVEGILWNQRTGVLMGIRKDLEAENRDPSRTPSGLPFSFSLLWFCLGAFLPFSHCTLAASLQQSPPQDLGATNSSQVCMLHPSCWKGWTRASLDPTSKSTGEKPWMACVGLGSFRNKFYYLSSMGSFGCKTFCFRMGLLAPPLPNATPPFSEV